jgi:hypothetical protein
MCLHYSVAEAMFLFELPGVWHLAMTPVHAETPFSAGHVFIVS